MKKTILTFFIFALSFSMFAQNNFDCSALIINPAIRYLNVRERPTVNSPIVDRVWRYEVFFHFCFFTENSGNPLLRDDGYPNWLLISFEDESVVGFVHKPHTISLRDLPKLDVQIENDSQIVHGNDTIQVIVSLAPFDLNAHEITFEEYEWGKIITAINGKPFFGMFTTVIENDRKDEMINEIKKWNRIITGLSIYQNGKKWEVPIDDVQNYFSPMMSVRVGSFGELYIWITVGDGGEVFSIMLSVVNGQIVYVTDF